MDLLPSRICQHFSLDNISVTHDPENNLVWVLTDDELPEHGDIERNNTPFARKCNRASLVKFISKIYKPVLWDNIGIAFTSFDNYRMNIKPKQSYESYISKEKKPRPVDEDVECFKNALSKLDSGEPKPLTLSAYLSIPKPPRAFFKPGKKRETEQIEIDSWKAMLMQQGYSLEDYRKMSREQKKLKSNGTPRLGRKILKRSDSDDDSS